MRLSAEDLITLAMVATIGVVFIAIAASSGVSW